MMKFYDKMLVDNLCNTLKLCLLLYAAGAGGRPVVSTGDGVLIIRKGEYPQ
jgi:hypothetical protein